ncbi:IucA/IucC family siderophore biosynthesis protein [Lysinibacillus sp. fkY74-1]|uniref:IucA/IucC family protein n=1 Tax=Lysinibacillus sphaericus TaxID=1421 RepID=UPI000C19A562|nr:IucA/IucC family protein [Lysinibacillus sphaericus]MEB7453115.1 siderophore biosynthesis protein [Lysinibacillus sphaericus]PIJ97442.1 siderophore biosynthesis protein [Lysinibacillus sphaericus]QIC45877.1 siderophore biosynthesis protein [Lysinibacillus sphaericus]
MQQLQPLAKQGELRVRRQLVEAMIFEGLIKYEETRLDQRTIIFTLIGQKYTYRCEGRRMAFDRIRIKEDHIFLVSEDETVHEATLEELVDELLTSRQDKIRLLKELHGTNKLCEWNERHLQMPMSRRKSIYEELESEIMEGHPYHPCFKSRTGFTIDDHAAYGPEGKQAFTLQWVAVRRSYVRIAVLEDEANFWKRELGHLLWETILDKLAVFKGTFEDYTFLPVHPWQWRTMKQELAELIEQKDFIPLDVKGDYYRATQSVRTLWNSSDPKKAQLKCSMNMVNTSSLRRLHSHAVCAAPHISAWLKQVIESDAYLQKSVIVLEEYAGIIFEPDATMHSRKLEGQFGTIWRESVRLYMKEEEKAVPFTVLMMTELDGRPFIDDWLCRYGTEAWIKRLIEVSVIPVWHLLVAHGIAVEAHAQNMILLHQNGWPTRIVWRDFHDSIEYTEEFIADRKLVPDFEMIHERFKDAPADQYYWMSSVEGLRELAMDTLFVFHLSELSYLLEEHYGYEETRFWSQVNDGIQKHFDRFPSLCPRNEQLQFTSTHIYVESLLKKKLQNQEEGNFRHIVNNTLAQADEKGK